MVIAKKINVCKNISPLVPLWAVLNNAKFDKFLLFAKVPAKIYRKERIDVANVTVKPRT